MKKLNITKKQYDESKYFTKKYGTLKFMSESGKLYKTDKGVVLALEGTEEVPVEPVKEEEEKKEEPETSSDEVTRGELTGMLKDVIGAVEKVCDAQDCSFEEVIGVEPKEEAEELDADEVVATKDEVAEVLADVIEKVEGIAEKAGIELPEEEDEKKEEEEKKEENECTTTECGDGKCECSEKKPALESVRVKKARMVREAIARRARIRKIREAIEKRVAAKKQVVETRKEKIARVRHQKILESIKARRAARAEKAK